MPANFPFHFPRLTPAILGLLLASCGGGGGAADTGTAAQASSGSTTSAGSSSSSSAGTSAVASGALTAVNAALIPAAKPGSLLPLITPTTERPAPDGGGIGAVRTVCDYSHFNFDDMLVVPGQVGASHLHMYFGNGGVNANSTPESVRTSGDGSCRGGIVNRSAYWVPAMIDTRTGAPVLPGTDAEGMGIDVYYKTGYHGVRDADVRPIPRNFRMIAGNSKSTGEQANIQYACNDGGWSSTWKQCGAGSWFYMSVEFPQCWDGRNLDSPDHKSHVAFATGQGCNNPAFPVALPVVSYAIKYRVPSGGMGSWRLSSDVVGAAAGTSGHGDYVFGWDETVFAAAITQIVNQGLSGGSNLVGNGLSIYK